MKRIISVIFLATLLFGCAASSYRTARANANQVKDGMTLAQASEILGLKPNFVSSEIAEWRRGNAQSYDGTQNGAIRFKLRDGIVVDVPEGGIFSSAGVAVATKEFLDKMAKLDADAISEAKAKAEKERINAEENAARGKILAEKLRRDVAAERAAIAGSVLKCKDKTTCSKMFSLSQIYISTQADQKIQVATDTIIETYNPTEEGKVGAKVVKTPKFGSSEEISIDVQCKEGKYETHNNYCILRRTKIYAGFRPFVESNLSK